MAVAAPSLPTLVARRRLAVSATLTVVGIAVSVLGDETVGGVLTVCSVAMLVFALHRFGRTGPE
jgi:hypothetical protein